MWGSCQHLFTNLNCHFLCLYAQVFAAYWSHKSEPLASLAHKAGISILIPDTPYFVETLPWPSFLSVKSCSGCFQVSTHLWSMCTFQAEKEIWPFAENALTQAPQQVPQRRAGAGRSVSFCMLLFNIFVVLGHPSQSQNKPCPKASHAGAGMHQGPQVSVMLRLLCFSKIYLNSVHDVCRTARYLDSIWVCYVWNVLTLHKFVRTEDYIKHKLAQGNHAASLPSPMHTRTDLLSAQTRSPFSPSSWFSESTLKCNSVPERERCSLISTQFYFFFFFLPPAPVFCPGGTCSSLQRIIYPIKENLRAV